MQKRGFTLIELLVVIAIIAVLIALLAARRAVGARGRAADPVHQQPEADGPGIHELRELHRDVPVASIDVPAPTGAPGTWLYSVSWSPLRAVISLHRAERDVQRDELDR